VAPATPPNRPEPSAIEATLAEVAGRIDLQALTAAVATDVSGETRADDATVADLADALVAVDWIGLLTDDPATTASNLRRAMLDVVRQTAPTSGVGTLLAAAPVRWLGGAASIPLVPRFETATVEVDDGGTQTTGDVEQTIDENTSKETTEASIETTGTDSNTGEAVTVSIKKTVTRDLCWAEDGTRQSSSTTETTVTRQTADGPVEATISTTVTVTVDPSGTMTASMSVTQDGYTVTITADTGAVPAGGATDTETIDGDHHTATITLEDGQTFTAEWDGDLDQEKLETVAKTLEEMTPDLAEDLEDQFDNLKKPLNDTSPGGNEYCIHLTLDPFEATLGPDGETLAITATVTDWADRPLVAAVMTVTPARLGSIAPDVGSTGGSGDWQTTYTSGDTGVERLTIQAARFGFGVKRQVTITIAGGHSIHWSDSKFGQTATFDATSCDGTAWTGTFSFSGSPGGATLAMATELGFETVDGHGEVAIVNTGTIGAGGEDLSIQMPYLVAVDIDGQTAHVVMTRQSDVVTVEGFTISAAAFPEFTFDTPLTVATDCP
jgi:hypothetical protein